MSWAQLELLMVSALESARMQATASPSNVAPIRPDKGTSSDLMSLAALAGAS
jgi:hypothetical protein